jgi:ADP-ribose pyrophosphatase YjhB (NUDIX family)
MPLQYSLRQPFSIKSRGGGFFGKMLNMIKCFFENGDESSLRHAVVNVLIFKDNRVLLGRRSEKIIEGGKWGLPGGFVDRGETLKGAVEREAFEETGYRVANINLLTVVDDPNRPNDADRQNIAFVFLCEAGGKEGDQDWEVIDQKWFSFDELPKKEEIAFDHYQFIKLYLGYKKENLSLPILR